MKSTIIILFLAISSISFGQKDSIQFHGFVNGRMMIQTGNLSQIGGGFVADLSFGNNSFIAEIGGSYNYVQVNGFNVVNDSWDDIMFKYKSNSRVYPFAVVRYGFAKSFGIKGAFASGLGAGLNIVNKSPRNFLNFNVQAGYLDFRYQSDFRVNGLGIESFVVGSTSIIKEKLDLQWQLLSYIAPTEQDMFGFMNSLRLAFRLTKSLSLTASHETIYNEVVDSGKQRLNTMFLFGLQYMK